MFVKRTKDRDEERGWVFLGTVTMGDNVSSGKVFIWFVSFDKGVGGRSGAA